MSPVSQVFHTWVTVNIGLKQVFRMVASIPLIRCLCYKPERIRPFLFLSPNTSQIKIVALSLPLFSLSPIFWQQLVKTSFDNLDDPPQSNKQVFFFYQSPLKSSFPWWTEASPSHFSHTSLLLSITGLGLVEVSTGIVSSIHRVLLYSK